jgi:hypothetical protein
LLRARIVLEAVRACRDPRVPHAENAADARAEFAALVQPADSRAIISRRNNSACDLAAHTACNVERDIECHIECNVARDASRA